jgi:hypothetical protein
MSGSTEVLQEYLIKLGFQTDAISLRKFEDSIGKTGKRVLGIGLSVAGVVASVEAASVAFAYSMRKIYFESELSQSSVKNLNAMEYAGKQIGITGDSMANSIHGMAQAMRLNPGLQGLIESFGVKVTGRDMSDVMVDFVGALKDMPEYQAVQYASMFGISPDDYHQMINHMDELKKKKAEMLGMYKDSGVDPDKAKSTMLEYTAGLDRLNARFEVLGQLVLIKVAPAFKTLATWMDHILVGWEKILNGDAREALKKLHVPKLHIGKDGVYFEDEHKNRQEMSGKIKQPSLSSTPASTVTKDTVTKDTVTKDNIVEQLQTYGWSKPQAAGIAANIISESQLNPAAVGDHGTAYGLAQWHPDRQAEFKKHFGKDIKGSSVKEQLDFLNYEMLEGKFKDVGAQLRRQTSASASGALVSEKYEIPFARDAEAARRGILATTLTDAEASKKYEIPFTKDAEATKRGTLAATLGGQGGSNSASIVQNNVFNITGTNAKDIADKTVDAQNRAMADRTRNMKGMVAG